MAVTPGSYHFDTYRLAKSVAEEAAPKFGFMTLFTLGEIVYEAYTLWAQCHMETNKPSEAKGMVCGQYEATDYSPAIYRRAARRMRSAAGKHGHDLSHAQSIELTRLSLDRIKSTDDAVVSACCAALALGK